MNRWYLVAAVAAGLWLGTPVLAQEGTLAPTAPVVPAPVLQNGNLMAPASGSSSWGPSSGPRMLSLSRWSPFRNPATASVTEPTTPSAVTYNPTLPPLPAGVGGATGACGPNGCAVGGRVRGRDRSCWECFKRWVCYHPSNTGLPILRPIPYSPPLMGLYPCTGVGNCGVGCAGGDCAVGQPLPGQLQPPVPSGPPMLSPTSPAAGAGAVMMPARGTLGSAYPTTWLTSGQSDPSLSRNRYATPDSQVVPSGYRYTPPK
jgi:hypothetical protein